MSARDLVATALALVVLASATQASAFCRTRGCNERTEDCMYDKDDCLISGPVLYWGSSCVSFDLQRDGSVKRGISYDAAHDAIVTGFRQWLSADCGGGANPSISISDFGPVDCRSAEYNQDAGNANIFMFRDDEWPYQNAIDTLALTTLIFNPNTGEIYDADVEMNTFESPMSIGAVGTRDIDFASVVTHEIGHFLGLSHSNRPGATMARSYDPGNTAMASIEADDVAGVCDALPPNREVQQHSCEPRHGFSGECADSEDGCQLSPGSPGALGSALLALLGLSSVLTRRRFRPSSPRP